MSNDVPSLNSQIMIYQTEDGETKIDVQLADETVWLTQAGMAELYETSKQNISLHLKKIFGDLELDENSVVKYYLTTASDGKSYKVKYYNLQAVLAVGYKVRSYRGTQFRRWATQVLDEYLVKNFVLNDDRLKEMKNVGDDYFEELLDRIRDIRASEKRFYLKIRDIYALSVDYEPKDEKTLEFFKTVQNKLHWAIIGKTAAEIISSRADSKKPNMGLTTWKAKKIRKADVTVAKNYLTENELKKLNRIVTMYLDYAETQAEKHIPMTMKDWKEKLDAFLKFNEKEILDTPGSVSKQIAEALAKEEYEKFRKKRIKKQDALDNSLDDSIKKLK